jgi:hypothetical protein
MRNFHLCIGKGGKEVSVPGTFLIFDVMRAELKETSESKKEMEKKVKERVTLWYDLLVGPRMLLIPLIYECLKILKEFFET